MTLSGFRRRFTQNAMDMAHPFASLARWPAWLMACASGQPTVARFKTGGLKMRLIPKLHSFGSTSIYIKRDFYEPELLAVKRLISPGSVVLDIGGSFGIFALFMAHFAGPKGRVHSFEPGHFSFSQLNANIALNRMEQRILLHQVAASDRSATLQLFHIGDSPVNFSIGGATGIAAEDVPAMRIADLVPAEDATKVSFIKIDVEGYEIAALEGARAILEAVHPAIMFEVSADALGRQNKTPADVYSYLGNYGYKFWIFEDDRFNSIKQPLEGNIFASVSDLASY